MKKIIAILGVLFVYQQWGAITGYFNPPPDYSNQHEEQVVMYATDWCPYCEKARQFMDNNGIDYYEYDIEKSSEGQRQYKSLGGNGVPLLVVNGEVIHGFSAGMIRDNLR